MYPPVEPQIRASLRHFHNEVECLRKAHAVVVEMAEVVGTLLRTAVSHGWIDWNPTHAGKQELRPAMPLVFTDRPTSNHRAGRHSARPTRGHEQRRVRPAIRASVGKAFTSPVARRGTDVFGVLENIAIGCLCDMIWALRPGLQCFGKHDDLMRPLR